MGDLFGDWIDPNQQSFTNPHFRSSYAFSIKEIIIHTIKMCPQHIFLFLTKCPRNLLKWSPFPGNCWVGATAINSEAYSKALLELDKVEAKVKYISFEPLLGNINIEGIDLALSYGEPDINWVIIGAQTFPNRQPEPGWVNTILNACNIARVPVFMKDNLAWQYHRREMPK